MVGHVRMEARVELRIDRWLHACQPGPKCLHPKLFRTARRIAAMQDAPSSPTPSHLLQLWHAEARKHCACLHGYSRQPWAVPWKRGHEDYTETSMVLSMPCKLATLIGASPSRMEVNQFLLLLNIISTASLTCHQAASRSTSFHGADRRLPPRLLTIFSLFYAKQVWRKLYRQPWPAFCFMQARGSRSSPMSRDSIAPWLLS